jgi:hypothetical protein
MHELVSRERPAQERFRVSERHLLLSRDFGLVWWGQLISQVGDGISKLALLLFVYSVTGSPIKTTVIGMLQTIPPIIFGPLIGVYLDRLPKKPVLIITDLLRALVEKAASLAGMKYGGSEADLDVSMRVIADHARTTAFLIAEGVFPDRAEREYVLRRVMRRAIRHGHRLGIDKPFLH